MKEVIILWKLKQRETLINTPEIRRLEDINSEFSYLSNRKGTDLSVYFSNPQLTARYSKLANERDGLLGREDVRKNVKRLNYLEGLIVVPLVLFTAGITGLFALSSLHIAKKLNKRNEKSRHHEPVTTT